MITALKQWTLVTALLLIALTVTSCAENSSEPEATTELPDDGSVSFGINIIKDKTFSASPRAIDCAAEGIASIEATVFDVNFNELATGGPWDCEAHSGTITGVAAGVDRIIVITAVGVNASLFWGEREGLTILAGRENNAGTIDIKSADLVSKSERYSIKNVSGDAQTWGGGGMPAPMAFRIFDKVNKRYLTNNFDGLDLNAVGNFGNHDDDWCWNCVVTGEPLDATTVTTWWYVEPCIPLPPYDLHITISALDSDSGEEIGNSPLVLNHRIERSDTFCTDAPNTSITVNPALATQDTSASFSFISSKPQSTFECRLDGDVFNVCTSPVVYNDLTEASHHFEVRAIDSFGNVDSTPAEYSWTIDLTPPSTGIVVGPENLTNQTSAIFQFSSSEINSTFECNLDGAGFSDCNNPAAFSGLAEGSHTLLVRSTDPAGNADTNAVSHSWDVDLTLPVITLLGINPESVSLGGVYTDAGATATDDRDGDISDNIIVSLNVDESVLGTHTVSYQVTDAAGNTQTATRTVNVVDTTPPTNTSAANFVNNGDPSVAVADVTLLLSATDNVSVSAFLVIDTLSGIAPDAPLPDDAAWQDVESTSNFAATVNYRLVSNFIHLSDVHVHVWFKDSAGLVSEVASDAIQFVDSPPVNCTLPDFVNHGMSVANSLYVGFDICATDNIGVTGFFISSNTTGVQPASPGASDAGWIDISPTEPNLDRTVYGNIPGTFATDELIHVFVWLKDQSGNIAPTVSTDTITYNPAIFTEHFNSGWGVWYADNSIWALGVPSVGPLECVNGSDGCMGTTLDGNYPDNSSSRLIGPKIVLPTINGDEAIHLRFQQWVSMGSWDAAYVQISIEESPGVWGVWQNVTSYTTTTGTWAHPLLDLSAYAGSTVRLGFLLSQGNSGWPNYSTAVGSGWYLDDIVLTVESIAAFNVTLTEDFLADFDYQFDWSGWYADNSIWDHGAPAHGPAECYSTSTACMATTLDGVYPDNSSTRLISPNIQLPTLDAGQSINLRFQHWASIGSWDQAVVQISTETAPREWSAWTNLATYTTTTGTWAYPQIDLTAYEGQKIRIGYLLLQGNSGWPNYSTAVGSGWYVDDVLIEVTENTIVSVASETNYVIDFENDWQNWYSDNSIWDLGVPTAGPMQCYDGTAGCIATTLDGSYPDNSSSRLISPTIALSPLAENDELILRLQQWVSMGSWDSANIQISVETTPLQWGAWETVATYTTSTGTWTNPIINLSAYAGQNVRIGFLLLQGNSDWPNYSTAVGSGWYIDDITLTVRPEIVHVVDVSNNYIVSFDADWDDWYTDNSIWNHGIPSAGPGACFNNSTGCLATTLDGNYPDNSSSRAISPAIQLPAITSPQTIYLRLQHWASIGSWDTATIQVSTEAEPFVWNAWENVQSYTTTSGSWAYPLIDLSAYAGQKIRLGLLLSQSNSGWPNYSTTVGSGWYVDDLTIYVFE